jgi:type IV pilus assembly protein PilA
MFGFTLIELMIVIATIAIILMLALPVYSNYMIRSKIAEALSVGNAAVTAVGATCIEDITIPALTNSKAGYSFTASGHDEAYVDNVQAGGPCTDPVITITTKNTGASPDPVILLTGFFRAGAGSMTWVCSSTSPDNLLPATCRD